MTLTRYALPAGVFLAVACLLAGCGHRPAPQIAGTAAAVQISQPGAVSYFFPATGLEFTAGARFAGTMESLESRAVAFCMARSGFHVQAETAAEAAAEAFDNAQFPDLARITRTGLLNPSLAVTGKPAQRPAGREDSRLLPCGERLRARGGQRVRANDDGSTRLVRRVAAGRDPDPVLASGAGTGVRILRDLRPAARRASVFCGVV